MLSTSQVFATRVNYSLDPTVLRSTLRHRGGILTYLQSRGHGLTDPMTRPFFS